MCVRQLTYPQGEAPQGGPWRSRGCRVTMTAMTSPRRTPGRRLARTAAALAAALALNAPASAGADLAAAAPPFGPGEQIDLAIEYLHVHTGQARIAIGHPEGAIWPVLCQG